MIFSSWAIVDYFLRPKPAYFTIARELRPYTVGVTRKEVKTPTSPISAAFFTIDTVIEVWGTNSEWRERRSEEVVLKANASTEIMKGGLPGQEQRTKLSEKPKPIVLALRLIDGDGTVLARYANWPEPFKFITFPDPSTLGLKINVESDGETITLSSNIPIKGIVLDVDGEDVKWSDQAIDLVPGDPQTVKAIGLNGRKIKARYLGDGSA